METIIAAAITGSITLIGVIIANSRAAAVTHERIEQLTKQVEKHNQVIERTYKLETRVSVLESKLE